MIFALIVLLLVAYVAYVFCTSPRCPYCNSFYDDSTVRSYQRGWNNLCEQACGDFGMYCHNCHQVAFFTSEERYVERLPKWCSYTPRQDAKTLPEKYR